MHKIDKALMHFTKDIITGKLFSFKDIMKKLSRNYVENNGVLIGCTKRCACSYICIVFVHISTVIPVYVCCLIKSTPTDKPTQRHRLPRAVACTSSHIVFVLCIQMRHVHMYATIPPPHNYNNILRYMCGILSRTCAGQRIADRRRSAWRANMLHKPNVRNHQKFLIW